MTGDLENDMAPRPGEAIDPIEMARRDLKSSLPKRFYKSVTLGESDGGYQVLLDGRPVRGPARNVLCVPDKALAAALAAEWQAQTDVIDPAAMPVTRIVNSALDGVAQDTEAVAADIVKYAGSDLLCYRAGEPDSLVDEQRKAWDPVLDWLCEQHDAPFVLAEGVMFVNQPEATIVTFRKALDRLAGVGTWRPLRLAALHVMTNLTGSALLAFAAASGQLSAREAWSAAHVDEDHQIRLWGEDNEASARRVRRWQEMQAAAIVFGHRE